MDISIKCNQLEVRYCVNKGMLRCIDSYEFTIHKPYAVQVCIKEMGIRIITMSCVEEIQATTLYSIMLDLERLLQIFDGAFIPLEDITLWGKEDVNLYKSLTVHLKAQRLNYFSSAKFVSVQSDRILHYEDVLDESIFSLWKKILEELGVVNQMYLYATSDCGLTNDIKCAFLVELSESLVEIIGKDNIRLQRLPNEKGNLKPCLRTIINNYGQIVFQNEIDNDIEKILTCLVNTRVNIMHIKLKQRNPRFDGSEATLYAIKMNYLYRSVLLQLLGIDEKMYVEKLKKRMAYIDDWNGIQNKLFERLK